jgi:hypothetical protein
VRQATLVQSHRHAGCPNRLIHIGAKPKRARIGFGESQLEQLPLPAGAEAVGAAWSAPAAQDQTAAGQTEHRKGELIFAPIPIASEAIGIGVAPVVAYVFFPSNSDRV